MTSLEAVTFDVTGTLIHSPRLFSIYEDVLRRHGIAVSAEDVRRTFPVVWQELDCQTPTGLDRFSQHPEGAQGWWRRFLDRLCELLEVDRPSQFAAAELFGRFSHGDAWAVYPEVEGALAELRSKRLRLAVLSNWDDRLPGLLSELDLASFFDHVVYSSELGIAKPNPKIFAYVLDLLGVEPSRALHLGDNQKEDVEGAQAAGMHALLLERRGGPDAVVDLDSAVRRVVGSNPAFQPLV